MAKRNGLNGASSVSVPWGQHASANREPIEEGYFRSTAAEIEARNVRANGERRGIGIPGYTPRGEAENPPPLTPEEQRALADQIRSLDEAEDWRFGWE